MSNTTKFDATVDFDTQELEEELFKTLSKLSIGNIGNNSIIGLHIPADDADDEMVMDDTEFSREIREDDWVLVCSANQVDPVIYLAAELRKLIRA